MAGFRRTKERIRTLLRGDDWQDGIRELEDEAGTPPLWDRCSPCCSTGTKLCAGAP